VTDQKETPIKLPEVNEEPKKPNSLKHHRRKRVVLQILKKLGFYKKTKKRSISRKNRKEYSTKTPKEWLLLSNSELVSHIALKYELGICKVNMKNARDISNCFSHIAKQVIGA
jgi:hypothetical protein